MSALAHARSRRPGAITPLAGLLLVPLVAMVAFAVDIAWIVQTKHQLQTAADAAALAGAQPLIRPSVQYNLPNQVNKLAIRTAALAAARAAAKAYAQNNAAGDKASLVLRDEDIEFGFTDANGTFTPLAPLALGEFPNTIRVTVRRDGLGNGALGLFFAPVLGRQSADLTAAASASPYGGAISGFTATTALNSPILPMAYDVDDWNAFLATGLGPDGSVSLDADLNPQLKVYPSLRDRGNCGELALDDEHAGTSDIRPWVQSGLSPGGFTTLTDRELLPVSKKYDWDWLGNPGLKADTISEVNQHTGATYLLPLFKAYSRTLLSYEAGVGNGSDYSFNIVGFVGIKIMPVEQTNKDIIVQPSAVVDPNATFGGPLKPAGTTSTLMTTFSGIKLTR